MAASAALIQALSSGDHVIFPEVVYWGVRRIAKDIASGWGIACDFVPNGDLDALAQAVRPGRTKLVWLETPSNPNMGVADIDASAAIAHRAGAMLVVDSTFASPRLDPADRVRRRHRDAFGNQVPQRPQRRDCRGSGRQGSESVLE
jgi:cystathionine gamma-synthase